MAKPGLSLNEYRKLSDEERELLRREEVNLFLRLELTKARKRQASEPSTKDQASSGTTVGRSKSRLGVSKKTPTKNTSYSSERDGQHDTQRPMTKSQLVAALAEATGSDKFTANTYIGALTEIITKEVANGGAVTLPGLGKFAVRTRPERIVRNPLTGEFLKKPADRVTKVTIAKALRDTLNS